MEYKVFDDLKEDYADREIHVTCGYYTVKVELKDLPEDDHAIFVVELGDPETVLIHEIRNDS